MTTAGGHGGRVLRIAASGCAALGLLFMLVTLTPVVSWWAKAMAGPWEDPTGEILIVLGGSILEDNLMGESSYWRAVYAVLAWREGGFRQVVLSGGGRSEGMAIVEPMRDFLVSHGIPRGAIQLETQSTSTHENALYTRALLAGVPGKKVLLTSDYHMFRAHRTFTKAGVDVLPRPFPDAGKRASHLSGRWPAFIQLVGETLKIGYYYARGWI